MVLWEESKIAERNGRSGLKGTLYYSGMSDAERGGHFYWLEREGGGCC